MLAFTSAVRGLPVQATDGEIGEIDDVYFDDRTKDARWLVIETGNWLTGRRVLLPTSHLSFDRMAWGAVSTDLTRRGVEESPSVDIHRPVSRQMEAAIYGHYGWAPYWGAPAAVFYDPATLRVRPPPGGLAEDTPTAPKNIGDDDALHLRSANEFVGYYVAALDGSLGHVEDMLVDPDKWAIDALVIDTRNWLPGKKVVLSSSVLAGISWGDRTVHLACSRDEIKEAPEYDARLYDPAA
jgi:sporulation protein YlmC with PRC-barrel domain